MKQWILRHPELAGVAVGLADGVFRAVAALVFDPHEGELFGPLLLGNVHHPNGIKGFGLTTMQWFAISAIVLAVIYGGVRLCSWTARRAPVSGPRPGKRMAFLCV
jgi:hypothetical protein